MALVADALRNDPDIADMLWAFDFAPEDNKSHGFVWADTAPLSPFEIVARRGSGCVYALVGAQRHVLFLTSEGQSGIIAASLQECAELIVAYPHWIDVAQQSGGDLDEMRRLFRDDPDDLQDGFFDDDVDGDAFRQLLSKRLKLGIPDDPGLLLHRALTVLDSDMPQRDLDGQPFAPLFDWLPARS